MLLNGVGCINGDLVVSGVAIFDAEVVVLEIDVKVGKDQIIANVLPNDVSHFVAVKFNNSAIDVDLRH